MKQKKINFLTTIHNLNVLPENGEIMNLKEEYKSPLFSLIFYCFMCSSFSTAFPQYILMLRVLKFNYSVSACNKHLNY